MAKTGAWPGLSRYPALENSASTGFAAQPYSRMASAWTARLTRHEHANASALRFPVFPRFPRRGSAESDAFADSRCGNRRRGSRGSPVPVTRPHESEGTGGTGSCKGGFPLARNGVLVVRGQFVSGTVGTPRTASRRRADLILFARIATPASTRGGAVFSGGIDSDRCTPNTHAGAGFRPRGVGFSGRLRRTIALRSRVRRQKMALFFVERLGDRCAPGVQVAAFSTPGGVGRFFEGFTRNRCPRSVRLPVELDDS